jgi:hypothetical protein
MQRLTVAQFLYWVNCWSGAMPDDSYLAGNSHFKLFA